MIESLGLADPKLPKYVVNDNAGKWLDWRSLQLMPGKTFYHLNFKNYLSFEYVLVLIYI